MIFAMLESAFQALPSGRDAIQNDESFANGSNKKQHDIVHFLSILFKAEL